jgi:exodeoxyribonuclease V beta subunit
VPIYLDEDPVGPAENDEEAGEHTIFTFTKGARAGIFFHDLFEHLDFEKPGQREFEAYVVETVKRYNIDPVWQDIVMQTIENVLGVSLQSEQDKFTLSMVAPQQRINEMEFYFPLKKISVETLRNAFDSQAGGSRFPGMQEHMGRLQFAPAKGFMKGFIDLVFSFNNRYYLLDWKSNHLGNAIDDYASGSLDRAMQHSHYTLQYHIYTLALHLFLQSRLPDYQYEKHFGGVFYLFIRGIDMEKGASYGVFYDRPAKGLVESLEGAMVQR